jgi:predicted alpha/beta superfamily hydrolase
MTIHLTLPEDHPANAPVFLAGTINGWSPNDEAYRFVFDPATRTHTLNLPNPPHELLYKFTRGAWSSEEVNEQGLPIENRSWAEGQDEPVHYDEVSAWRDTFWNPETSIDEVNVFVWHDAFWMPQLNRSRRIWVYLPPDYESSTRSYPVIYMHDAQNLFVNAPVPSEKWRVARTLNRLFDETNWGCIVIGVEHGNEHRLSEYSPVQNPNHGGGEGHEYLRFLTETLKPLADATFRTRPDAMNTAMIGSSMGGLISVYAALLHGDVFGKVAAFSPSLWWNDDVYRVASAMPYNFVHKLVLLGGQQESDTMLPDLLALYYTLIDNGYFEHHISVDFYRDGAHSEWFWGREFERAVRWLFSPELPPLPDEPIAEVDTETREIRLLRPFVKAELINGYGKTIYTLHAETGSVIPLRKHWRGLFALECLLPNERIELKKIIL